MDHAVYTPKFKFAVIYSFQCTRKKKNHVYTVDPDVAGRLAPTVIPCVWEARN